jgi:hypothetical protein
LPNYFYLLLGTDNPLQKAWASSLTRHLAGLGVKVVFVYETVCHLKGKEQTDDFENKVLRGIFGHKKVVSAP